MKFARNPFLLATLAVLTAGATGMVTTTTARAASASHSAASTSQPPASPSGDLQDNSGDRSRGRGACRLPSGRARNGDGCRRLHPVASWRRETAVRKPELHPPGGREDS